MNRNLIIIAVVLLVLLLVGYAVFRMNQTKPETFNINQDPLEGLPPVRITDQKVCTQGQPCVVGGQYGLTPEYNCNLSICDFIAKYDPGCTFQEYPSNTDSSMLLYEQDAYDIPARQICEVLYQGHQQYFENMWSGLGECELWQKEQAKKCKNMKTRKITCAGTEKQQ